MMTVAILVTATLVSAQVTMNIDATKRGPELSPYQWGLFFEEINHAGDGGLWAEMIDNGSFEQFDERGSMWATQGGATATIVRSDLLNGVQTKALKVNATGATATSMRGISNNGYWAMAFDEGAEYKLSLFVKTDNAAAMQGRLFAQLQTIGSNAAMSEAVALVGTLENGQWTKMTVKLRATGSTANGQLALLSAASGTYYIDVVSMFPADTWKGHGLRRDLAEMIAETRPTFVRFPGGCFVEGYDNYGNAYQWKRTIGPLEQRVQHKGNWGYYYTAGMGYDEYLQMCEDLGAAPLFVVSVGMGHGVNIPMNDLDTLVQNTLDAIEYANGDGSTEWGARRIANGHAEPYNLKMIEIGNENYQPEDTEYPERYIKFYNAIKEKYPDIICIGNVEAWGTDDPSWRTNYPVDVLDEHYYRTAAWMRQQYNKYDTYSRSQKIYNGEYAANGDGATGTLNTALAEAVFMLGQERNSDICYMGSFAPALCNDHDPCWAYTMLHYDQSRSMGTPSYYVQKMFGQNDAGQNLLWTETGNTFGTGGKVGVGAWSTRVSYDDVKVSYADGATIIADDFSEDNGWTDNRGTWSVAGGVKQCTSQTDNCTSVYNTSVGTDHYTYSLRARKDGGNEGFLVIFNYADANNYAWWNIGGWGNTQHAVEVCRDGVKTTVASASGSVQTGQWYDLRIEVEGENVKCYMDNVLIHSFKIELQRRLYQSVQIDEQTSQLVVKVVNTGSEATALTLNLQGMTPTDASGELLTSASLADVNTLDNPTKVTSEVIPETQFSILDSQFATDVPARSFCIFRIDVTNVAEEEVTAMPQEYLDEDRDMYGYLNCHMNGTEEITNYALSRYGTAFDDLLGGGEVFDTKTYTTTGGMRDAFIYRMQNGDGFILVGTDMTSRLGWQSNHIMDIMYSNDMVHWTKEVKINLKDEENVAATGISAENVSAAWAPQVIWDPVSQLYVMYYSVGTKVGDYHSIWYSLLDRDLNIKSEPRLLFDPGYTTIDADIVWNAVDRQFVMTYKDERTFHLYQATAPYLVPQSEDMGKTTRQWTITPGFEIYESGQAIEAPSAWRPIGSMNWKMAWVNYGRDNGYKLMDMDEHCLNPQNKQYIKGNISPQHGSFMKLTEREYNYLLTWEQVKTMLPTATAYYNACKEATSDIAIQIGAAVDLVNRALSESGTFDEEVQVMEEALAALQTTPELYQQYLLSQAEKGNSVDMIPLLSNADFSQRGAAWAQTPTFTQANGEVAEYWNTMFDFSQTITGIPNGDYEVGVQAFYRDGAIDQAWAAHTAGTETLRARLYANSEAVSIKSIFDSQKYTYSPYTFPDNVAQANTAFNADGEYHNTLRVTVTDGSLTIGIRAEQMANAHWCCFDNFTLQYLGKGTDGIHEIEYRKYTSPQYFDLNGCAVVPSHKGIYIMGGKKILVK